VDCSAGVLYGSWFMPTAEVWFGWIGPMVFCMDLGLCQLLRFGSVDWSNGVLYGSWFMPTAVRWIGPMVFCMDLGLCQLLRFSSVDYSNGGSL
jgi:hypothetical protein